MKEIVILLVTFLGICKGFTQKPSDSNGINTFKISTTTVQNSVSDSLKENATVKLFPNPAKNKTELEIRGFESGNVQLQIINVNGKLVRNDSRILFSGNENIVVMFSLPQGVYFIVLKQKDKLIKKKMLVQ
jgi:hypothetical protein